MTHVEVTGWEPGFKSISFIKLVRNAGLVKRSLPEAKDLVDGMIVGNPFTIQFASEAEAREFLLAAEELGAKASEPSPGIEQANGL